MKVKYTGKGITSRGIKFLEGSLHDLPTKDAKYLLDTFPTYFILIEATKVKTTKVAQSTKKAKATTNTEGTKED